MTNEPLYYLEKLERSKRRALAQRKLW